MLNSCIFCISGYSFEFVKAIGSNITGLNVMQGQEISGKVIIGIAKQGPIYLRAKKQLCLLVRFAFIVRLSMSLGLLLCI